METEDIWTLALALPQVTEEPHFDYTSFRIRGKIFATVPPDHLHVHVFLDEADIAAAVAAAPAACAELHWGKKCVGVRVNVAAADRDHVAALLATAWRKRAPKRLASA